ncbi:hypothetical protein JMN32_03455 [Fulvivirga sp. 29W222]|uniref:Uncharacterized protein n=1 Tax=Fulvivirga marina TaxID=2494733 RepID=A0A937FUQ6_9BACT|nr:hypothetical protein [Fulvivirga marina]MBL6445348.1 hypothetical protein [Fulvivirga marina]
MGHSELQSISQRRVRHVISQQVVKHLIHDLGAPATITTRTIIAPSFFGV